MSRTENKLQLSDALRLGSVLIPEPAAGNIQRCGIAMAILANDHYLIQEEDLVPLREYNESEEEVEDDAEVCVTMRNSEALSHLWRSALANTEHFEEIYSWTTKIFECPWCPAGTVLRGSQVVHHPFDSHVMTGSLTMEALCTWIASIEPPPECYGPPEPAIGAYLHFQNSEEKNKIVQAAKKAGMSLNAYITAAARLAIDLGLPMDQYQREDPEIKPGQSVQYVNFNR